MERASEQTRLGIGTGNPGVFQDYPHPYRRKPVPVPKGTGMGAGSAKTPGYATRVRVRPQNQLKNLATAVQVSIDTALQHCEVSNMVGGWYIITNVDHSWAAHCSYVGGWRSRLCSRFLFAFVRDIGADVACLWL
jgi:hypothetical protein